MIRKLLSDRPVLIGGLGIAVSLSLLGGLQDIFVDSTTLASMIAVGTGVWWWRRHNRGAEVPVLKPLAAVERESVEAALGALSLSLVTLQEEASVTDSEVAKGLVAELEAQRQDLLKELDRSNLTVAIAGPPRSGKTALMVHLEDLTPASAAREWLGELVLTEVHLAAENAASEDLFSRVLDHDAVVYLITEDLTESALADLKGLVTGGQRVIVSLNKQDNYLPDDRAAILEQLKSRLRVLPQLVEVVAIATAPKPIKVRTYEADGQVQERFEAQTAEVGTLTSVLETWLMAEVPHLVTQTVMRQTHQLRQDIQGALNQLRRQQAMPLVEQLQWTSAATAFASPLPSLDVLAAISINGQLVLDLGRIYQQPLSFEQAQKIAAELAAMVVKLGLVEVSTQLLTTALKSHAATYVVGGSVQAFSAAYLTRLSGEGLMAYLEERALTGESAATFSTEGISQKLQALFPKTQRAEFLQTLVKQGIEKLTLKPTPVLASGAASTVDPT